MKKIFFILSVLLLAICTVVFILPNYNRYSQRGYVQEGYALAVGSKEAVMEFYAKNLRFPHNSIEANSNNKVSTKVVKSIEIIENGIVVVTYTEKVKENGELILTPIIIQSKPKNTKIAFDWKCNTNTFDKRKMIPNKFLPTQCRS